MDTSMTRRSFVKVLSAGSAVLSAGGCRVLGLGDGEPRLVCGVISDLHLTAKVENDYFEKTLCKFREAGVDAVIIAGDLTDGAKAAEFARVSAIWQKVFPGDALPDGRKVTKLFVTGNHDVDHLNAATWQTVSGDAYAPMLRKDVKGVPFILRNWYNRKTGEKDPVPAWFAAQGATLPKEGLFFYIQHEHPSKTCCVHETDCDSGAAGKALAAYPNAIAISGHSHFSIAEDSAIWQGAYTSVATGQLCGRGYTEEHHENGAGTDADSDGRSYEMLPLNRADCVQAQLMRVYGSRVVFERLDMRYGLSLGEDVEIPVGGTSPSRPYALEAKKARAGVPQWPAGSVASVVVCPDGKNRKKEWRKHVVVDFPPINGLDGGVRAFDFAVTAELCVNGTWQKKWTHQVFSHRHMLPAERDVYRNACSFKYDDFPVGDWRFTVTPRNAYGICGKPLVATWHLAGTSTERI